jgi:hypothetical protein
MSSLKCNGRFSLKSRCHLLVLLVSMLLLGPTALRAQEIIEQKKSMAFAFGTIHPRNADGTPIKGPSAKPLEVDGALGTVFFVGYPDARGGPDYAFIYVVTAKHVLKDTGGGSLNLGTNLRFLGILSGSFLNRSKGTILDAQTAFFGNDMNTGISFIVPAGQVRVVLDSPSAQAHRDSQIQKLSIPK